MSKSRRDMLSVDEKLQRKLRHTFHLEVPPASVWFWLIVVTHEVVKVSSNPWLLYPALRRSHSYTIWHPVVHLDQKKLWFSGRVYGWPIERGGLARVRPLSPQMQWCARYCKIQNLYPGFPREGRQPLRNVPTYCLTNFPENCMKIN